MGEMSIIKRSGQKATFDKEKIAKAIFKAAQSVGGSDFSLAKKLAQDIEKQVEELFDKRPPTVEEMQDLIEDTLIEEGHARTAKAYILYRHHRAKEREERVMILGEKNLGRPVGFSTTGLHILKQRYLLKDQHGEIIETPEEMLRRLAKVIAQVDKKYNKTKEDITKTEEEFYDILSSLSFLPNSPALRNAGSGDHLSSCLVLPIEDTLKGVFQTLKDAALTHQRGSGTGFSFSRLRPKGDFVGELPGVAAGAIAYMNMFDTALETVKQGGVRPGANMAVLRVDHPDILRFIEAKSNKRFLQNFNMSVAITDRFMRAVEADRHYYLTNPRTQKYFGKLRARDVFALITHSAWKTGDPGLIFIDEINRKHPAKHLGEIETTNQCGEAPLLPNEACPLGAINLDKFVNDDKKEIEWDKLAKAIATSMHFLDNMIDANSYLNTAIERATKATRKCGLGYMGFADTLLRLGIKYDSQEGLDIAEKLIKFLKEEAYKASEKLAKKRGVCPAWSGSEHEKQGRKMRNMTCISISPTGTRSLLANASPSCEPLFALAYHRTVFSSKEIMYVNKYFKRTLKKKKLYSANLMRQVARSGSIQDIPGIPKEIKDIFVTAQDISPEWHIKMQAALQKYVDNSISKTINFPTTTSIKDVEEAFMLAWRMKCKGLTIYRDGSYEEQVITVGL